ncbi:MAG: hypothetical protein Q9216_003009 [Gyalolechia sp. 2 TL-2023]
MIRPRYPDPTISIERVTDDEKRTYKRGKVKAATKRYSLYKEQTKGRGVEKLDEGRFPGTRANISCPSNAKDPYQEILDNAWANAEGGQKSPSAKSPDQGTGTVCQLAMQVVCMKAAWCRGLPMPESSYLLAVGPVLGGESARRFKGTDALGKKASPQLKACV